VSIRVSACILIIVSTALFSSYEIPVNAGSTHFLEINAFKSTTKRSHLQILSDMERLGGGMQCIATRENIFYCIDILKENVISLLTDSAVGC
jgi:predicted Zn-dependent peptidase